MIIRSSSLLSVLLLGLFIGVAGCQITQQTLGSDPGVPAFVKRIEHTQGINAWRRKMAVAFDLEVGFGGRTMLSTTVVYDMHGNRCRMELAGGEVLVYDGSSAWVSPSTASVPMTRFHLTTWTYFLSIPFKLRDPGSSLTPDETLRLDGESVETALLTFDAGVGDTPEDWYLLYPDPSGALGAMAYIVTYGKSATQAEKEPHAIRYRDYETIDGVTLSTHWTMHHWSRELGLHGAPIGEVTLSNLRFVPLDGSFFDRPADSKEDLLPTATAGS